MSTSVEIRDTATSADVVALADVARRRYAPNVPIQPSEPSLAVMEHWLTLLAGIVKRFGPVYLPLFERMERDIEARRCEDDALQRALRLAERDAA